MNESKESQESDGEWLQDNKKDPRRQLVNGDTVEQKDARAAEVNGGMNESYKASQQQKGSQFCRQKRD